MSTPILKRQWECLLVARRISRNWGRWIGRPYKMQWRRWTLNFIRRFPRFQRMEASKMLFVCSFKG
jgi:hypothetical protein